MKNKPHILILFLSILFTNQIYGQIGIGISTPDSNSTLDLKGNSLDFNSIQQNLLDQTGKNSVDEAVQYYNLGIHFYNEKQYSASEDYFRKSLEIYKNSTKKNRVISKGLSTSKVNKQNYNQLKVNLALVDAYSAQGKTLEAYKLINTLGKQNPNSTSLLLKKLEVYQAHSSWQELYDLCLILEKKTLTKAQLNDVSNKKSLSQIKLGYEDEIFQPESEMAISLDDIGQEESIEFLDKQTVNSSNTTNFNNKRIQSLDYSTQNEIAKTYQEKNELDKELNIRESITKDKKTSVKQKAIQKLEIGKILTKTKSNSKAKISLTESLILAEETDNYSIQKETILKLINLYKKDKDTKNQLKYYEKYKQLSLKLDSLIAIENKKSIVSKSRNLEQQEVIKNIQEKGNLYQKDKSLRAYETTLNANQDLFQKIIIICLAFGLLLLLIALLWYHKQRKIQKNINLQLELKNMRNQMNPHFIFNSLNAVNHFISQKNELMANEYLTEFALLMRNTLNQSDLDLIPLSEELVFLKRYCELEKMRFESQFDFSFNIDSEIKIDQYKIPPLLLQPFVENAVWHGLRYLDTMGKLTVFFTEENNQLKVQISDNGIGRTQSEALKTDNQKRHKSKGVNLIKRRIDISNMITPTVIEWEIKDLEPNGTEITLYISKPKS